MIVSEMSKSRGVPGYMNNLAFLPSSRKATGSSRVDDTLLIRAAQQGDATAFEQLVRQYDRAVLRLAVHLTGSQEDGQDMYQEAFLRAYINLGRFRFECSFYTWIYRIVTNLCLDHLRKKNSRGRDLTTTVSPEGEEVCALTRLSPRERVVFELKHYHGLKLRTVAGILNTTEGTIKNTLFRATHKLRLQLAEVR